MQQHLAQLGLTLSAEKTKTTTFREGFAFLGFVISSWTVTMRPKSVEKFKTKIRELTPRHHNLDARGHRESQRGGSGHGELLRHLVLQCRRTCFARLDRWIRMRIRCMKFKRKRPTDNWRLRRKHLRHLGFVFLTRRRGPPLR